MIKEPSLHKSELPKTVRKGVTHRSFKSHNLPPDQISDLHIKKVPKQDLMEFKAACNRMGVTMQNAIVRMMRDFAARQRRAETGQPRY